MRKKTFDYFHQWVQSEAAERASSLWADGDGDDGAAEKGFSPRPAVPVEIKGLLGDAVPEVVLSSRCGTADVPSRMEVREALRAAAAAAVEGLAVVGAPTGNTGHKFTVHWADVTAFTTIETVASLVATAFFADFNPFDEAGLDRFEDLGPVKNYGHLWKGPGGICLKSDSVGLGEGHSRIELCGEVFDLYGMAPFARLLASLEDAAIRWHTTRVDTAFDGVGFTPDQLYKSIEKGDVRSLAERKTLKQYKTPFGEDAGLTTYYGSRKGGNFLRCYDRRGEPRLELEHRGDRAKWFGLLLVSCPLSEWGKVSLGCVRTFIDIVRRDDDPCVSRCGLVKYWRDFIGGVERCKMSLADGLEALRSRARVTVEAVKRTAKSIQRRAARLYCVLGEVGFVTWIRGVAENLGPVDRAAVADWKAVAAEHADAFSDDVRFQSSSDVFGRLLLAGGGG